MSGPPPPERAKSVRRFQGAVTKVMAVRALSKPTKKERRAIVNRDMKWAKGYMAAEETKEDAGMSDGTPRTSSWRSSPAAAGAGASAAGTPASVDPDSASVRRRMDARGSLPPLAAAPEGGAGTGHVVLGPAPLPGPHRLGSPPGPRSSARVGVDESSRLAAAPAQSVGDIALSGGVRADSPASPADSKGGSPQAGVTKPTMLGDAKYALGATNTSQSFRVTRARPADEIKGALAAEGSMSSRNLLRESESKHTVSSTPDARRRGAPDSSGNQAFKELAGGSPAGDYDPETGSRIGGRRGGHTAVPVLVPDQVSAHKAGVNTDSPTQHRASERFAYWVDQRLTRGRGKTFGLIAIAIIQVVVGAALLYGGDVVVLGAGADFGDAVWRAWTYMADAGTHAREEHWLTRGFSFIITGGGILFFAALVGFVVDSIRARMEELKRGKSRVIEAGHYLVLGFTDKSFTLLLELALAMESEGGGVVVILAEREKDELEQEIGEHFGGLSVLGSKLVVRSGSPILLSELTKVSAATARSIVVLAEPGDADKSDAKVLRTILSIVGMKTPPAGHVVAEMRDIDNEGLVEIVGRGVVETIVSHDVIGRLMIKCARQPGLAKAYDTFLGFEGDEFYLNNWPELVGRCFDELSAMFPSAIPVGLKRNGHMILNPSGKLQVLASDQVLFLAEDDDTYFPCPPHQMAVGQAPTYVPPPRKPERMLMSGWRRDVDDIICLLDALVMPGSELHMLCEVEVDERDRRLEAGGLLVQDLQNLRLVHHVGNPAFRRHLEMLPLEIFDSVLIISDESLEADSMHSDSNCLASLLLTRHIQEMRFMQIAEAREDAADAAAAAKAEALAQQRHERSSSALRSDGSDSDGSRGARGAPSRPSAGSSAVVPTRVGAVQISGGAQRLTGTDSERLGSDWTIAKVDAALESAAGKVVPASSPPSRAAPEGRVRGGGRRRNGGTASRRSSDGDGGTSGAASAAVSVHSDDDTALLESPQRNSVAAAAAAGTVAEAEPSPGLPAVPMTADAARLSHEARARQLANTIGAGGISREERDNKVTSVASGDVKAAEAMGKTCVMCCELLDARTRGVVEDNASVAVLSDFILSNNIISRTLAMVAERREVKTILMELLGPEGQEVGVIPASKYVQPGERASFWEVSARARRFHELVLGYKQVDGGQRIHTNPPNKHEPLVWDPADSLIVMHDGLDELLARTPGLATLGGSMYGTPPIAAASGTDAAADLDITAGDGRREGEGQGGASAGDMSHRSSVRARRRTARKARSRGGSVDTYGDEASEAHSRRSSAAPVSARGGRPSRARDRGRNSITAGEAAWLEERVMARRNSQASHASHASYAGGGAGGAGGAGLGDAGDLSRRSSASHGGGRGYADADAAFESDMSYILGGGGGSGTDTRVLAGGVSSSATTASGARGTPASTRATGYLASAASATGTGDAVASDSPSTAYGRGPLNV